MTGFQPGLELAEAFYTEVVGDLVACPHTACLLGEGSEVLGFDSVRSTDHAWGPRLQILVDRDDIEPTASALERHLPETYRGWPVRFFAWLTGTVRHHVEVTTLDDWIVALLGFDPRAALTPVAWLALPQQKLLRVTRGRLMHDDSGEMTAIRRLLRWYPRDAWLWMMASQWHLIGNAAPLVGRTAEAGDQRGSALISAQIVRLMMELVFLQERTYWPYPKWFGTAFSRLDTARTLGPDLDAVIGATAFADRERALLNVLKGLAERHNALDLTPSVDPVVKNFEVGINDAVRPYRVFNSGDYVSACRRAGTRSPKTRYANSSPSARSTNSPTRTAPWSISPPGRRR